MSRHGQPIEQVNLKYKLNTGIEVRGLIPGIVPKLYEMAACRAANYRYHHDWQKLTVRQKADLIADYYIERMVESHKEEAVTDKIRRDSKRRGAK